VLLYVAGIGGLVGSHVAEVASARGIDVIGKKSSSLDLLDREAVFEEFRKTKPDALVIAAAKVGGIEANRTQPVAFLSKNLQIQCNLIDAAFWSEIENVVFLGSSCIYPRDCPQPIREESLLTGKLEPTNSAYAIAKIAGIELIESYRKQYGVNWKSILPCNLYGPRDNFDLNNGHVLAALIKKIDSAVINNLGEVEIWGDGTPLREFLFAKDAAHGILHILQSDSRVSIFNLGTGIEISIHELAKMCAQAIGYEGSFVFNKTKPNGTPRKVLDVSKIRNLGWRDQVSLEEGIKLTHEWYVANRNLSPEGPFVS
jgi:GDP-L-fucose synthase